MRFLRLDSTGGASGDMLLGVLIGLGADIDFIRAELEKLLPGHFTLECVPHSSCGISGIRCLVEAPEHHHHHSNEEHHHHHDHHHWSEIRELLTASSLPAGAKRMALDVFSLLAQAEGKVHGKTPDEVAFHEVGAIDSIVDITGCCLAWEQLQLDGFCCPVLPTGFGTVHCAHGVLPVPAPATAELLARGKLNTVPGPEEGELLTPTGAALLSSWPQLNASPARTVKTVSSFGKRELKQTPNLLRGSLCETMGTPPDALWEICCNLDDCTGERLGALSSELLSSGAADVWCEALTMKKSRPGVKLCLLASEEKRIQLETLLLHSSGSFGLRRHPVTRNCLERKIVPIQTPYGKIPVKAGYFQGKLCTVKAEFDFCLAAAQQHGVSVSRVQRSAEECFYAEKEKDHDPSN